jgi:hypothetical protein
MRAADYARTAAGSDNFCLFYLTEPFTHTYDSVTLRYVSVSLGKEDDVATSSTKPSALHFKTTVQASIPMGRNGKHKEIVTTILKDLDNLKTGSALKVPIAGLAESKEKVRSALNRATRKESRKVATATDAQFLYIWNVAG